MEQIKGLLRTLTKTVCNQLRSIEIPKRNIWTVVESSNESPHLALDTDRPLFSALIFPISIWLSKLPEYTAAADTIERDPDLSEGVMIDAGGFLRKPERINATRVLLTNFLLRYLEEGESLDWDPDRFEATFSELKKELKQKRILLHTTMPLSNLRMGIDNIDFGSELRLQPATKKEIERWLNPDRILPPLGIGPPGWSAHNVDKPAVLHAQQIIAGRIPDIKKAPEPLPQINADKVITALRLIFNTPISIVFQEQQSEGMMAFGGYGTSWVGYLPYSFQSSLLIR